MERRAQCVHTSLLSSTDCLYCSFMQDDKSVYKKKLQKLQYNGKICMSTGLYANFFFRSTCAPKLKYLGAKREKWEHK